MFGISIELEPVAIIKFVAVNFFSSFDDLTVIVFLSIKDANPLKWLILFFLNKKPMPDVNCLTILSLRFINLDKSRSILEAIIPCSLACWENSINFSDELSKAFEGIQPVFKQVPPNVTSFSTHATFIPS